MINRVITTGCLIFALLAPVLSSANGTASVTIQIAVNLLPEENFEPQFQSCAVSLDEVFCDTDLLQSQSVDSNGQQVGWIIPI